MEDERPPPECKTGKGEEDDTARPDAIAPMDRFRRLTSDLLSVSREQLREKEHEYQQRKRAERSKH